MGATQSKRIGSAASAALHQQASAQQAPTHNHLSSLPKATGLYREPDERVMAVWRSG